ncbi:MAG: hypothetical protein AB1925_04710 [Actinomycetota bacterium]
MSAAFTGVYVAAPAASASADTVPQGIYSYSASNGETATWEIWPSCVPIVGDLREPLDLPIGCSLNIKASTGRSGRAKLSGDQWLFIDDNYMGITCPDGTTASVLTTYRFDGTTLHGEVSVSHGRSCESSQPNLTKDTFTLTYTAPLAVPVQRYPLQCEPGGLRRCS